MNDSTTPSLRCFLSATIIAASCLACSPCAAADDGAVVKAGPSRTLADEDERAAEAVVELSPFVVESSRDRGYQASNTMSGTRLNSALADLAASITVINKQQIIDTASIDINDLFINEANTEGTRQFNATETDRNGNIVDAGLDPHTANRVRGLSAANMAINGFASKMPVDTYNVDSVEISRGPNSSIFGLGAASGSVNIIPTHANTSRNSGNVTVRLDSLGGTRGSFDINNAVIKRRLAFRVMGLHEERGFARRPAVDRTKRITFSATARPFRLTDIKVSYERYDNFNRRPNTVTPQDSIAVWKAAGSPTWDPVTWTAHVDGRSILVTTTNETVLPAGLIGAIASLYGRPSFYVDNGVSELFMVNRSDSGTTGAPNPFSFSSQVRIMQIGSTPLPLYSDIGISDRSLYDWTSQNLLQPNSADRKIEVLRLTLEQYLINNSRQILAFQFGLYDEKLSGTSKNFVGSGQGTPLKLLVDVNERLLNGDINPYFLLPYFGGTNVYVVRPDNDTSDYRFTLAYQLDLTKSNSFIKWLGKHRLTGYSEWISTEGGSPIAREYTLWNAPGATQLTLGPVPAWRYYVGNEPGDYIVHAPNAPRSFAGAQNLTYFNRTTQQWQTDPSEVRDLYYAGTRTRQKIETRGFVWQAFLLNDRLLPLWGVRRDTTTSVTSGVGLNPGRIEYDMSPLYDFSGEKDETTGTTMTKGIVIKPFRFLSFYYNEADSFSPAKAAVNVLGERVPLPTGEGRDYGVKFALFQGRVVVGVNFYKTLDKNTRKSDLNVLATRAQALDFGNPSASFPRNLRGSAAGWTRLAHPDWSDEQVAASVVEQIGLTDEFVTKMQSAAVAGTVADINESRSKGVEIESNININRYWTMKIAGAQIEAINSKIGPSAQAYLEARMPIWTTIKNPNTGLYWWTESTSPTVPASGETNIPFNQYTNTVGAPYKLAVATLGKSRPQIRKYRINLLTNYRLSGLTSNKYLRNLSVGGSFRWESRGAIGYLAGEPDDDGIVRTLDPDKPVYDKEHFRADLNMSYTTRMFRNKVRVRFQLNVRDVFEDGRLQPIAVNPDGQYSMYSIIDPRQFIFTATFDF